MGFAAVTGNAGLFIQSSVEKSNRPKGAIGSSEQQSSLSLNAFNYRAVCVLISKTLFKRTERSQQPRMLGIPPKCHGEEDVSPGLMSCFPGRD